VAHNRYAADKNCLLERAMTTTSYLSGLQLRSSVKETGELELSLITVATPQPGSDEVVVRVEATPINPSDIGLLFGAADLSSAKASGTDISPVVTMQILERGMGSMAARVGQSLPVGNEGAGVVVATGESAAAIALMGKTVAVLGGAMYAQFRTIKADQCLVLPEGATAANGASCFVNPLTALGMVETMRREGHKALVHTAAASNLGQMLNKICIKDQIGLVNIVRKPEQAALLKGLGARYVTQALVDTRATIAFDATGGGKLAGQILTCMEAALNRTATEYGATVPRRSSRSTSTAGWIRGRQSSCATLALPGAWADGCFFHSCSGWASLVCRN
jgi:NADPH:quinone reductase